MHATTPSGVLSVLHTESSTGWGGQENRTLNEMLAMRRLGWRCLVACRPGAILGKRAKTEGFAVHEINMRGFANIPAMFGLRHLMRREEVTVVNTHSGRDNQLACMAAHSLIGKRPILVRTRHLALPISSRLGYCLLPDHVVTVSNYVRRYIQSEGIAGERVTAVATGIDLSLYQCSSDEESNNDSDLRTELGLPANTLLVGTIAILRKKKGHADLLSAIPQVLQYNSNAHFIFAGDGPQMHNIRRQIADNGLQSRVHLLGLRKDVINILRHLDIFVLPTHQEALGTAFIEAGAMRLPTIGTTVDGVPEVIVDGATGLLTPPHNPPALAAAIGKLLAAPELRRRMGEAARARVEKLFSQHAMGKAMQAVYEKLLHNDVKPGALVNN